MGKPGAFSDGPERDSEFVVRLPLADTLPAEERVQSATGGARDDTRRRRILLVDDNESFTTAMTGLLRAIRHDVHAIYDGAAAADTVRALRPDVVLLDITLPGTQRYDIAREIRAEPALAATLLVAMTGYGQDQDKRQAQSAGFDHHITKPLNESALETLLATMR